MLKIEISNQFYGDTLLIQFFEELMIVIASANNDAEAKQRAMEYIMHLPVIHLQGRDLVSFGNFLGASEPISAIKYHSFKAPFRDSSLFYLKDLFFDFIHLYRDVVNQWHFSYPQNMNGEIMTERLAEWQKGLMNQDPNNAYIDFTRNIDIDGQKGFRCCLITMESIPEDSVLNKLLNFTTGAGILRVHNPNEVYFINKSKNNRLEKIDLSADMLLMWDKSFILASQIINISADEFSIISELSSELAHKIIDENIFNFCNQLNVSSGHKELFINWMKSTGGQEVNRFVDFSMLEMHFSEEPLALFRCNALVGNWVIKNNKPTFFYSVALKTIIGLSSREYCKFKDNQFIQLVDSDFIDNNKEELSDLMRINSEVELNISRNNLGEFEVKPSLVKYEVTCLEALTDSGKTLLSSPDKKPEIMSQLCPQEDHLNIGLGYS